MNLKKWPLMLALCGCLLLCLALPAWASEAAGTSADPLVTLSYLNKALNELKFELTTLIQRETAAALDKLTAQGNTAQPGQTSGTTQPEEDPTEDPAADPAPAAQWELVRVLAGEMLLTEAGTELVLRSGAATAIASADGGLADLTAGVDLATGDAVERNHHLLTPRSDYRGVRVSSPAYIMVRGGYQIGAGK